MTTTILRREQDAIEFYTIESTGESGMSQTSLGILSGVSQQAISKLENSLTTKSPSESLEPWVGKVKTLTTNSEYKNATIYCSGFCSAVIQHYAFKGNKVAQLSLTRFSTSGIDKWIQEQTGWHQETKDNGRLQSQLSQLTGIVTNLALSVSALVEPRLHQPTTTKRQTLKPDLNHPNPEIKEIPTRTKIRKLVNSYCYDTNQNYRNVYQYLYQQYKLRYGYDVYRQCEKTGQQCKLTQMETDGEIDRFHQMVTVLVNETQAA